MDTILTTSAEHRVGVTLEGGIYTHRHHQTSRFLEVTKAMGQNIQQGAPTTQNLGTTQACKNEDLGPEQKRWDKLKEAGH